MLDDCLVPALRGSFGLIHPHDVDVHYVRDGGGGYEVRLVLPAGDRVHRLEVRDGFVASVGRFLDAVLAGVAPGWSCVDPFMHAAETWNGWTYGLYAPRSAIEEAFTLSDPARDAPPYYADQWAKQARVFFPVDARGGWTE